MRSPWSPEDIDRNPDVASATWTLAPGQEVRLRPLRDVDPDLLGDYFLGLSPQTVSLYGPHPFDRPTARRICAELDRAREIPLVATMRSTGVDQIVAYFILGLTVHDGDRARYANLGVGLVPGRSCRIAPSVADDFQNRGLGSAMMRHVMAVADRLGQEKMILQGGVFVDNHGAVHFYRKHGFTIVGRFGAERESFDMLAELGAGGMLP